MAKNEERITELELRFMDQSRLLDQLSDEIAVCHQRLDELVRENATLRDMVRSLEPENETSPDE